MSAPTVFYSWQSDLERTLTRDVIHAAAALATDRFAARVSLEDAPRLDHDTQDEAGAPAISETIFRKIASCAIFVADVSYIGKSEPSRGKKQKKLPNPNVLLELGYATATIGWERVVLVMNKTFGNPENLPFDLKHRRFPITYSLTASDDVPPVVAALADELHGAMALCFSREYGRVNDVLSRLSSYARTLLKDHGAHDHFFEAKPDNTILSRLDLAILQLLELGVVRCVPSETASGVAYGWTYLGRECCRRLGVLPLADMHGGASVTAQTFDLSKIRSIVSMPFLDQQTETLPEEPTSP